jgi:IMP dehydrogenase
MRQKSLELSDVFLIPRVVSEIESREKISTSMCIGTKPIFVPIIASPMKDVCDKNSLNTLIKLGCYGIMHRFCSIDEQAQIISENKFVGAAIGINGDCMERYKALVDAGCTTFCVDVANGANITIRKAIDKFIENNSNKHKPEFIVGNVASAECYFYLANTPQIVGIRTGIAGGSACSTKNATGVYHPMASLILECKRFKEEYNLKAKIIADGGIKEPQDFCKAIALGADCVMMGSTLAAAIDSPAELIKRDGRFYKVYHGSASFEIQKLYRDKPRYIEGKTTLLDFNNENLEQIIQKYSDGLRSSMSYFNAKDIEEYQKNITWGHR